jgi:hypothetical protein
VKETLTPPVDIVLADPAYERFMALDALLQRHRQPRAPRGGQPVRLARRLALMPHPWGEPERLGWIRCASPTDRYHGAPLLRSSRPRGDANHPIARISAPYPCNPAFSLRSAILIPLETRNQLQA